MTYEQLIQLNYHFFLVYQITIGVLEESIVRTKNTGEVWKSDSDVRHCKQNSKYNDHFYTFGKVHCWCSSVDIILAILNTLLWKRCAWHNVGMLSQRYGNDGDFKK